MKKSIITLGEIMLRLSPPGYERFLQAKQLDLTFGGGEANVAVALAGWGHDSTFVTKLPANPLGDACFNELRKWGVNTSRIRRGGDRLGIYFCEKGAAQRPSSVIYDRAGSAIAGVASDEFDWPAIFAGADWFHFTGITPALSPNTAELCLIACQAAKSCGLSISCDLNYRKKLWSREQASSVMSGLMSFIDVLICNEEDPADLFGIKAPATNLTAGALNRSGYADVTRRLCERFGRKKVAITLRQSLSASVNNWSGMLFDGDEPLFSKEYNIHIVDRVGGGDAFAAGLIHGLITGMPTAEALEFAVAASCLKHTISGDLNIVSLAEVQTLCAGDGSGRVQR